MKIAKENADNSYGATVNFMNSRQEGIWVVIPARGGSKGIPRKNIHPLGGRPLIEYTIDVALNVGIIDRVIVSTDCPQIAEVSRAAGAEVPFLRPEALSTDAANMTDAIYYTVDRLGEAEGRLPERLAILYPTSPFRTPALVSAVVDRTARVHQAMTCLSGRLDASRLLHKPNGCWTPIGAGALPTVRPVGVVVAHHFVRADRRSAEAFPVWRRELGARGIEFAVEGVRLPDPVMAIDIDTQEDLALAEAVLNAGRFDFGIHELHARRIAG